jgi:hypothetical protein
MRCLTECDNLSTANPGPPRRIRACCFCLGIPPQAARQAKQQARKGGSCVAAEYLIQRKDGGLLEGEQYCIASSRTLIYQGFIRRISDGAAHTVLLSHHGLAASLNQELSRRRAPRSSFLARSQSTPSTR